MKERGRGERYKRVREGEKRQYQWVGEDERRAVRKDEGLGSTKSKRQGKKEREKKGKRKKGQAPSRVRERLEGRRVWPTLTEGYVRKERHKTPAQQYKITYTEGRKEKKIRKRYVGRKRVLAGIDRPRKLKGREDFEGMAMQQDHRTAWDRVERQRRREYRKDFSEKEGRNPTRVRKRMRRKCERARNIYEYSRRRMVEKEVRVEREEGIRKRKEGGHREPTGWWERRWEREERAIDGTEAGEKRGKGGSKGGKGLKGEAGRMPTKEREEREEVNQVGRKREAAKVGSEGRHYRYGEDCGKYRERYRKEVGKREKEREGPRRDSMEVRNRRERGKWTLGGSEKGKPTIRKNAVRKSTGVGYTGRGEGYGRRGEEVRAESKEASKKAEKRARRGKKRGERKKGVGRGEKKRWWEREGEGKKRSGQERGGRKRKGGMGRLGEGVGQRYGVGYRSENPERRQLGENVRRSSKRRTKAGEEEWSIEVEAGKRREAEARYKKERGQGEEREEKWRRREKREEWERGRKE